MPIKEKSFSSADKHEKQLTLLKRQVKAIMEEAVTKKFIHEESPQVLRMCGTVEHCLLDGLKKRSSGFRRTNAIANLYAKVAKGIPEVSKLMTQIEDEEVKLMRQISSENNRSSTHHSTPNGRSSKYLWLRMAVKTKLLDKIVDHLVQNHKKFYEDSSIMADPVQGKILASLLVGPCALEYTKVKTHDHYWSDPPADELLQRHRLHSRDHPNSPGKRPTLHFSPLRHTFSTDSQERHYGFREYVESLHQNSKASLLYGKNNVVVQPQEDIGPVPGYLSLHQEANRLMIKWTPNQLMNSNDPKWKPITGDENGVRHENGNYINNLNNDEDDDLKTRKRKLRRRMAMLNARLRCCYWEFAISVDIQDIVYLHCHQQSDKESTLVLVGQDGVQWPPIRFPPGGHLLTFLSCLETALLPHGCLDPPLWSQKGKGKIFPRLIKRTSSRRIQSSSDVGDDATDYVFRVITSSAHDENVSSFSNGTITDHLAPFQLHVSHPSSYFPLIGQKSSVKLRKSFFMIQNQEWSDRASRSDSVYQGSSLNGSVFSGESSTDPSRRTSRLSSLSSEQSEDRHHTGQVESDERFVPNLDMYVWDHSKPRRYNEPPDYSDTSSINFSGSSLRMLCDSMRRQIISRAFYGWLAHCRHIASVRTYLIALVNKEITSPHFPTDASVGVTEKVWKTLFQNGKLTNYSELARHVYYGGVRAKHLRPLVWLYLLGYYHPESNEDDRRKIDEESKLHYSRIRMVDNEIKLRYINKVPTSNDVTVSSTNGISSSTSSSEYTPRKPFKHQSSTISDVFISDSDHPMEENRSTDMSIEEADEKIKKLLKKTPVDVTEKRRQFKRSFSDDNLDPGITPASSNTSRHTLMRSLSLEEGQLLMKSIEESNISYDGRGKLTRSHNDISYFSTRSRNSDAVSLPDVGESRKSRSSTMQSEASDLISVNLTQIEKDVFRCDRNHVYFTKDENLRKLSNIMSCFVWENPEAGYVQGMCDLAAPLLVLFDDESLVYSCFVKLMEMISFQKGNAMDVRLANLRSLIQVLDYELYEHLHKATDSTHFFFCYRWFLLEFKRELSYDDDVFAVWECSWAARSCSTQDFGLFFALAMLKNYRDIILENELDFSGIVKFFNEMAEKHDGDSLTKLARQLVSDVQRLIQK